MKRFILAVAAATLASFASADTHGPFVEDEMITETYNVSGDDLADLERQMRRNGPRNYWAYAKTNWNWDGLCNMSFRAHITMPKLVERHRLDAAEQAEWDRMIDALWEHEMGHVEIGKAWASAIKAADCRNIEAIDAEWGDADAEYDRRTDHGQRDGVYLRQP